MRLPGWEYRALHRQISDLAEALLQAEGRAHKAEHALEELRARLEQADDLLRRLSEWDMLYVSSSGTGNTADAPFWQAEIGRVRSQIEAALGGASGASSTAALIPGADPGSCPECGEWRKAGILHECLPPEPVATDAIGRGTSTGSARPPDLPPDRSLDHSGTPVGVDRLKQAHSHIRDSWFDQPWMLKNPTHGHPVYRQSQDEDCFFCAVIAGWEHAEEQKARLEGVLRDFCDAFRDRPRDELYAAYGRARSALDEEEGRDG